MQTLHFDEGYILDKLLMSLLSFFTRNYSLIHQRIILDFAEIEAQTVQTTVVNPLTSPVKNVTNAGSMIELDK